MEYITLGNSGIRVSRTGFGCCPMGRYGWGAVREEDLLRAVDAAISGGVNLFDTADIYGLGESERILGKALKGRRGRAVIATKSGMKRVNGTTVLDSSPGWIMHAVRESLKRLGTDYIDLYFLHYHDGRTPWEDIAETLENLRQKGIIRAYGVCNIKKEDIPGLMPLKGRLCAVQNEYSLAARYHEEEFKDLKKELSTAPIAWGSLGQGILTGKYGRDQIFGSDDRRSRDSYVNFHGEKLEKNLRIAQEIRAIAYDNKKSPAAVALRWILDTIPESAALAGAKTPVQVTEQLEAVDWKLKKDEWGRLDELSRA